MPSNSYGLNPQFAEKRDQRLTGIAPGSVVVVRDAEWVVLQSEETTSGTLVRVKGVSELVRDSTAAFYSDIDHIEPLNPEHASVVADDSSQYRRAKLWLEATMRTSPTPWLDNQLTVTPHMLADALGYQRAAVERVLDPSNLRPRILLADAVGLGKTLEIGMILSELVKRGRGDRILVVTPRHVLEQMQHELWTRFALPFVRLDSVGIQKVRQQLPATRNPFSFFKRAIISIDTLKQDKYRAHLAKHRWDAVVIDESHNITGRTQNNKLARLLARNTEALILASATPHNGKAESFAELIRLLEPTAVRPDGTVAIDEVKRLVIRRHRNSAEVRGEVGDNWAERLEPQNRLIEASPAENAVADELSSIWLHPVSGHSPYSGQNSSLFPWTLAKSFLSSPAALQESIDNRRQRLSGDEATPHPGSNGGSRQVELEALNRLRALNAAVLEQGASAKIAALIKELKRIGVGPRSTERAVVFSERVPTLHWVVEQVRAELKLKPEQVGILHGGLSDVEQLQIVDDFKRSSSPIRVLITGDVASEGVNLHAQCHELIHFDIPWSLIRIEQRNGRIDRYGQRHRPQITTLVLDPANERFSGDVRVLSRLLEREHEAHTALGDAASLMGEYDVDSEENAIRDVLAGSREFDEVVPSVEDAVAMSDDPFMQMYASMADAPRDHSSSAPGAPSAPVAPIDTSSGSTGLFPTDRAFLKAAVAESFEVPGAPAADHGAGWREPDLSVVELEPPRDLRRRLDVLPQSYLTDRQVATKFSLATEHDLANRLLREARNNVNSTSSWPEAHFLGPLHPVLDWVGDRALSRLGRNQVFAVRGDVEVPTVLVQASLTNRRGQVVAQSISIVPVYDVEGDVAFAQPVVSVRDALTELGIVGTNPNPGPVDVSALQGVIAPAVRAARVAVQSSHASTTAHIEGLIEAWSGRVESWEQDADALVSSKMLRQRRMMVEEERDVVRSMLPQQTFVRALLVVVPMDAPVAAVGVEA